jgi:hypothetical protein
MDAALDHLVNRLEGPLDVTIEKMRLHYCVLVLV